MFSDVKKWTKLPMGVQRSIMFTIAAWVMYLAFLWFYLQNSPGEFPSSLFYKHLGMGAIVCLFLALQRPWAKWLGALGNTIAATYLLLLFGLTYQTKPLQAGITFIIALLFAVSTYYLFCKESAEFFKVQHENPHVLKDYKNPEFKTPKKRGPKR
jgi:peptidoglycan/LPS O-acetylase OafA/YrhL